MEFSPDLIDELVPQGMPPDLFNQIIFGLNDFNEPVTVQNRSYAWANYISLTYLPQLRNKRVYHFSTGFVHVPKNLQNDMPNVKIQSSFAFGAYLLVHGKRDKVEFELLQIENNVFPLIKHYGPVTLHSSVPHPSGGSSTCWVRNRNTSSIWNDGILTCRHIVSAMTIGSGISLAGTTSYSKPTSASVADMDECTIDAAVLEISPSDFPGGVSRISVCSPVSPGMAIEFNSFSGSHSGYILRTFQMNNYFGNLFGQRIVTDCFGSAGDSGSLLKTAGLPVEGVGIYMGCIPDGSGGYEGINQCLLQVANIFDLDLHL